MVEEIKKLILSENDIKIEKSIVGDTDDKNKETFIIKYFGFPKFEYVSTKHVISEALRMQGYNDFEIHEFIEGAEDIDEYRAIIRNAKQKFLEEYEKVIFIYPESLKEKYENITFPIKEAYILKKLIF